MMAGNDFRASGEARPSREALLRDSALLPTRY
jgi:hypothetical protein